MLDNDFRRSLFYPKADLPLPDEVLRSGGSVSLTDSTIAQICAEVLGTKVTGVESLASGTFHRLWRVRREDGRPVIFRANAFSEWFRDDMPGMDVIAQKLLRQRGFPAVHVHSVDFSRERCPVDFSIMDEARGTSLRAFDDDEQKLLPLLTELGRFLANVHRIDLRCRFGLIDPSALSTGRGPLFGLHETWDEYIALNLETHVKICVNIGAISEQEAQRIFWLFEGCRGIYADSKPKLLHGDPGNHNVFVDDGQITTLIDWEDAVAGDPVYEIAFWATFHPERRHAAFLDGYRSEATLPADFEPRFWLYFLRVSLAKTVLRHRLGLMDMPGREPAARRIQKSLQKLTAACGLA